LQLNLKKCGKAMQNYRYSIFCCFLILNRYLNKNRGKPFSVARLLIPIIFLSVFLTSAFFYPGALYCDNWLKVDTAENNLAWVDTSHWETKSVYVNDGYYKNIEKKRWVDTSYTVSGGYWETGQYRVWVKSSSVMPHTEYRYVDTSHWETTTSYVEVQKPVFFSVIFGTDSYGWSVYSFAAKFKGMKQVTYKGEKYLVNVYVIDYRPARGGQVYAVKYVFLIKFVKEKRVSSKWVSSGYWQPYTAYKTIDTSHWETRTGRHWVDTSYTVNSGYWENYTEKQWVDTGHYEDRRVWVSSGYYTEPLHGKVTVQKSPEYVFTKWHKDGSGKECGMELKVTWEIDNSELPEGEPEKKISKVYIYQETVRYKDRGNTTTVIKDSHMGPSASGQIESFSLFDYAGSDESILHIYLYALSGEVVHVYFSSPVNGFKSINIKYSGTSNSPEEFLGGNYYGEVIF
jgi:hypothetical protein